MTDVTIDRAAADARIAKLEAELRDARASRPRAPRELTFKVSEKGACSVYGLGRFPVTLYESQWAQLLKAAPKIESFLKANAASLTRKDA